MRSQSAVRLEGELAVSTLRALRASYRELNDDRFEGRLRAPSFVLSDTRARLGCWDPATRTLEVSKELLLDRGWGAVVEVLAHEMAHQYVQEVLRVDETPHGEAFRRVCAERGIEATASGEPAASEAHPVLDRVRKLLALAGSANEHEAQSAARLAQRLMLRHNIDALAAERRDGCTHRQLGRITGRTLESERILGNILQDHFFVDVIWVHAFRPEDAVYGRVMEVCGRPENVALADYVHDFLTCTADRLWREHKRGEGIRGNRERRTYLAGVMAGFRDRLEVERRAQQEEGLVWVGDPELGRYFRRRHRRVSTRTWYEGAGDAARESGRRAGREIVLHRGVESRARGDGAPRQLASGESSPE